MTTLITTYQHDFPAPDATHRYDMTVQKERALHEDAIKLKCAAQARDKWEHAKPEGEWTRNQVMGMLLQPRIIPDMKERPECVPAQKFTVNQRPEQYPFCATPGGHKRCPDHITTYQCDFPNLDEDCRRRFNHNRAIQIDRDVMGCEKDPCGKRTHQENERTNKYGRVRGITAGGRGGGGGSGGGGSGVGADGGKNGGRGNNGGGSGAFGGGGSSSNAKDPGPPCSVCLSPPTEYQDSISKIGDIIQTKHFHDHSKCRDPKSCRHSY